MGNYETADFFSSRSMDLPVDSSLARQQQVSEELFNLAMMDAERDVNDFMKSRDKDGNGFSIKKLVEIIDKISVGKPMSVEDYEKLNNNEQKIIQSVKRAYNRSPLHKDGQEKRDPYTGQADWSKVAGNKSK